MMNLSIINILNFRNLQFHQQKKRSMKIQCAPICLGKFKSNQIHVVNHDHFTGNFCGYAHQACNFHFKDPTFIPTFFHNLSGYDKHLFIREIVNHRAFIRGTLTKIPITEENYTSFSTDFSAGTYFHKKCNKTCHERPTIRLLDSMRFRKDSLDNLSSSLSKHSNLEKFYPGINLLCQRGVYPYEYMDSFHK